MTYLKVLYAHNENRKLVKPDDAKKREKYYCPNCNLELILRKGQIKTPHFAHKVTDNCSQESITHLTAKYLIRDAILNWRLGKCSSPIIKRKCSNYVCHNHVETPIPQIIDSIELEYRLNGYVIDLVLMSQGNPKAGIEIRVTHKIDDEKALNIPIPFIELNGQNVIENPYLWIPEVDKFKMPVCQKCKEYYKRLRAEVQIISQKLEISLPDDKYYYYSLAHCWKCRKKILVFGWPGGWLGEKPEKLPIPQTVKYEYSKTLGRKQWANICFYCNSIQGNYFLYRNPETGVFFATGDDLEDILLKQIGIAYYYYNQILGEE